MNSYRKLTITIASTILLLGAASACGSGQQAGHDYYYSSNVKPQFTPSAPLLDNNAGMTANSVAGNESRSDHEIKESPMANGATDYDSIMNGLVARGTTGNGESGLNASGNVNSSNVSHDLMMNGQTMNEQQQQVMNTIRKVNGVNDATIDIMNNKIIVGLDVENIGRREAVVNDVKNMLQQHYRDFEIQVTARKGSYNRIRALGSNDERANGTNRQHDDINLTEDLRALIREMKESFSKPLR